MNGFGLPPTAGYDDPYGVIPSGPILRPMFLPQPINRDGLDVATPTPAQSDNVIPFPATHGGYTPSGPPMLSAGTMPQQTRPTVPPYMNGAVAPVVGRDISPQQLLKTLVGVESSGRYNVEASDPNSTASGVGQWTNRTWNNYGGYKRAMYAPKEVQDRRLIEDLAGRINKYNGDLFKIIADHYLPAYANNPASWRHPVPLKGRRGQTIMVPSVESYVRKYLRGKPYEKAFDEYINAYQ